jgi:Alpha-kinase family
MLEGEFLKFNSNSGYTNGADFMQALSHFSYHHSNGQFLCDLQGGHYEDVYVLTDPVIMSSGDTKTFGATDLGEEGIGNFFAHHTSAIVSARVTGVSPTVPQFHREFHSLQAVQ